MYLAKCSVSFISMISEAKTSTWKTTSDHFVRIESKGEEKFTAFYGPFYRILSRNELHQRIYQSNTHAFLLQQLEYNIRFVFILESMPSSNMTGSLILYMVMSTVEQKLSVEGETSMVPKSVSSQVKK